MSLLHILRCTLIASTIFCAGNSAQCQSFIRLSGGINFPQGDFADTEVETDGDGMAMTGGTIDLSFGLPVYKSFGIIASARYQGNKFDPKPLADYTGGSVHADAWESMAFLAGAFYDFNVHSNFLIKVYAQGGLLRTRFPTAKIVQPISGFNGSQETTFSANAETAGAGLVGVLFQRRIAKTFWIGVATDYLFATQTFDFVRTQQLKFDDDPENTVTSTGEKRWVQHINGVNAMISLTYVLKTKDEPNPK